MEDLKMLKITIDNSDQLYDQLGGDFSRQACDVLIDYFDGFDDDVELDRVAFRCEFNEMTENEIAADYSNVTEDYEDVEEMLENETVIIGQFVDFDGNTTFVFVAF